MIKRKKLIYVVILIIFSVIFYFYYNVLGIEKGEWKIIPNFEKKEQLKALFIESDFTRTFSSEAYTRKLGHYMIYIADEKQDIYERIYFIGGEYISNFRTFKVKKSSWNDTIEKNYSPSTKGYNTVNQKIYWRNYNEPKFT